MLTTFYYLFMMECKLRLRRSQEWLYPLAFFLILIAIFPLAVSTEGPLLSKLAPSFIWLSALFASLLGMHHFFLTDTEDGYFEQAFFAAEPLSLIILASIFAQWTTSVVPLLIILPFLMLTFHLSMLAILVLLLGLLLGTFLFHLLGSFAAALTVGLRHQGMLIGLILLPLVVPVMIFGINMVQQAESGLSIMGTVLFLVGITLLAMTLLPYAIASVITISLDH